MTLKSSAEYYLTQLSKALQLLVRNAKLSINYIKESLKVTQNVESVDMNQPELKKFLI